MEQDPAVKTRVAATDNPDEIVNIASEVGCSINRDEVIALTAVQDLSDDELEDVAGEGGYPLGLTIGV